MYVYKHIVRVAIWDQFIVVQCAYVLLLMTGRSMVSLGGQCWVSNLIRECYPAESNHSDDPGEDGHSGVFDWIATCPSMVGSSHVRH